MKGVLIIIVIVFCLFSCEKNKESGNEIVACGIDNPKENIIWLSDLIKEAENDKSGNYVGTIWLEKYEGSDIFVTNMAMGSGGVAFYFFDCKGNSFVPKSVPDLKFNVVVYTNLPVK